MTDDEWKSLQTDAALNLPAGFDQPGCAIPMQALGASFSAMSTSSNLKGRSDADDPVAKAARCIHDGFHPEDIYVFGSRARGDNSPDSDVDLLVLIREPVQDPWVLAADMRRTIGAIGVGVDVIVMDLATWHRERVCVGSLAGIVAREGHSWKRDAA